jgi:hypothetical protein
LVKNTFADPDEPVYPVEAVDVLTSPVPLIVKLSLSKPLFVSWFANVVVLATVPILSENIVGSWALTIDVKNKIHKVYVNFKLVNLCFIRVNNLIFI